MEILLNYQSSLNINDDIYVDPVNVREGKAKYIFLTHPHYDHFSVKDIEKIIQQDTKIICPQSMKDEVAKHFNNEIVEVEPDKNYKVDTLEFSTFPSYNTNKNFHLREYGWVGYILNIEGKRVAVAGDGDDTEDLENIKADILLIPIGGTYTMNAQEAAKATNAIKPKIVVPIHYGDIVGSRSDAERFSQLVDKDINCKILR